MLGCPQQSATNPDLQRGNTSAEIPLAEIVANTLNSNLRRRQLSSQTHGAWQIFHGILAYGKQLTIDTPAGTQPAIEYALGGGGIIGFEPSRGDAGMFVELQPMTKVGQGHRDGSEATIALR